MTDFDIPEEAKLGLYPSHCVDCNAMVLVGQSPLIADRIFDSEDPFVIIHSGEMCERFRVRFTPSERNRFVATQGLDERGNICVRTRPPSANKRLPEGPKKPADKSVDKPA